MDLKRIAVILGSLFVFSVLYGQLPQARKYYQWSQKGYIIYHPTLSNIDNDFAFSARLKDTAHIENILQKIPNTLHDTVNRKFDPVVVWISPKNNHTVIIDYGWTPAFSPDGKKLVYAYQQSPFNTDKITASSLKGNSIKWYDVFKKTSVVLANPIGNYLFDPLFVDSLHVIYKTGDAVNGPYGGGTSINMINTKSLKYHAVQQAKIQYRLYDLMGDVYLLHNKSKFAYTVYSPLDSGKGIANEYAHLLVNGKDTLFDFGVHHFTNLEHKLAFNNNDELIFLQDDHISDDTTNYIITYKNNKIVEKKRLDFKYVKAFISPDGKYVLYTTGTKDCYMLRTDNFQKIMLPLPKTEIHTIAWANNSGKLAIVQDHPILANTDILNVFEIH